MRLFVAVRWKADPHVAEPNWIEKEIKWSLMGQIFVQRPAWCTSGMLSMQQFQAAARPLPGGLC